MDLQTRLKLIKKVGAKFNKKIKRNQRVRKTESQSYMFNQNNINHYTDASRYAEEYYGDRMRQTTRYDSDWD
tara:strand:+ start:1570 stop:1785 length:216 start_codon:yes stop_codon:yes gene_type:complete